MRAIGGRGVGVWIGLTLLPFLAVATPLTVARRFAASARGDIAVIGNTNFACPSSDAVCVAARAHLPPAPLPNAAAAKNNYWVSGSTMIGENVNVDPGAGFPDSSSAELKIPSGATVLYASLHWGGQAVGAANGTLDPNRPVWLRVAGQSGYVQIEPERIGSIATGGPDRSMSWGASADVTRLVQAAGAGDYFVADLVAQASGVPNLGPLAGWSLVVAFSHPTETLRNLSVFDGYQYTSGNTPPIDAHIDGFVTPAVGAFDAKLGVVILDGDRGDADTAPQLAPFVGGTCSNAWTTVAGTALNPQDDFANSTFSYLGQPGTYGNAARNPSYNNSFGLDLDVIPLPLGNDTTAQCVRLSTASEGIAVQAMFTSIEIFQPVMDPVGSKIQRNLTHPALVDRAEVGDEIEYELNLHNVGQDPAADVLVVDPIPAGTHYVPGSLSVSSGANSGPKTDAAGDDQAEFDGTKVVFRLGAGANASAGGQLDDANGVASASSVRFRVTVDAGTEGTTIDNVATASFRSFTTNETFTQPGATVHLVVDGGSSSSSSSSSGESSSGTSSGASASSSGSSSGQAGSSGGEGEDDSLDRIHEIGGGACSTRDGSNGWQLGGVLLGLGVWLRRRRR